MNLQQEFHDKTLTCIDCDKTFIFSENEQRYFASKGLLEPKRCPDCRKRRRDLLAISKGGQYND
ncbi:zinc-ribbon domain containing protein [Chloroflexota bacterium]